MAIFKSTVCTTTEHVKNTLLKWVYLRQCALDITNEPLVDVPIGITPKHEARTRGRGPLATPDAPPKKRGFARQSSAS